MRERPTDSSGHPRLSGDGRFVVFESVAANLIAPRATGTHVFLRDRIAGVTRRLSAAVDGTPANRSSAGPDISDDGAVVVFHSAATNLSSGEPDLNGDGRDVYRLTVASSRLERVSVDGAGRQAAWGASFDPSVTADGSAVAFTSTAPLTGEPSPERREGSGPSALHAAVFVRDVRAGTTTLVSRGKHGRRPDAASFSPAISADGRRVAFASMSTRLGPRDRNRACDIYLYDLTSDTTILVSSRAQLRAADGPSVHPAVSADGRMVAFASEASDLLCSRGCPAGYADQNLVSDVYLTDTETGATVRLSGGTGDDWWAASAGAALDGAGRVVAFSSMHPSDDSDGAHDFDAFVRADPSSRSEVTPAVAITTVKPVP